MKKFYIIALALITCFAIILQLVLLQGSIVNFVSYFTILSNFLVASSLLAQILSPQSKLGKFSSSISTQTAITLYILIVGLVYNTFLRGIWEPKGWQLVADNLLHVVVPILYVLYWFIFIPKNTLNWKNGIAWMYFPLIYLFYSLIRGHFTGWYPYPFLNVIKLGYGQVFVNVILMVIAFFAIGLLLIAADRGLKKKI